MNICSYLKYEHQKLRVSIGIWFKATLTFFAPNQVVTISKRKSFFSRLILLSKDLIAMDAIFLHRAESSFTIIRQRGIKNIPQFSWSSPWKKTGTYEHTETGIPRCPPQGRTVGTWGLEGNTVTSLSLWQRVPEGTCQRDKQSFPRRILCRSHVHN